MSEGRLTSSEERCRNCDGKTTRLLTLQITRIRPDILANDMILSMMVSREPYSKHGRQVLETGLTTKELKEEWMKPPPAHYTSSLLKKTRSKLVRFIPSLLMKSGHPEERTREKLIVMGTAAYVEKIMPELIICGGIAKHSTNPRTLDISSLCKSDTKSKTNL
eukprot:3394869-Heterocapsa_arctica.AAC.1